MTIFVVLFLVLFLILIFQIIRLIYFAIKKKELSKEVKKTCVVFLCNVFAFILVGMTAPENIKNKAKESGIKKKAEKVKEVKKKAEKEKKQVVTDKKKVENKTSVESIKPSNEVRVTKNKENGDFVLQIIVPENATEEEISRILMDTAVANKKRFQGDNIMVVAYSDEHYMYKSLLGTHGQMRLINGGTDFIKISPKENINAEDKKDFKEYFDLYQGFKDFGDDDETARKETQTMLCGRNKERCKEIIKKSEKYFFDINNK
jgi:hypothetical protein|nr:MAG TPA: hypothetical protein [Caudoviricetes sp.]